MGPWSRVRIAKCQMLVTGLLVLLLGLAVAAMSVLTYFGANFTVISSVSLERNPYEAMHRWAFFLGLSLAGLLTVGAVLCVAATVREAAGLMAGGFLCFSLVFCVLVQVAFWRFQNPTQVEDVVLDTFDLVYEQAVRSPSSVRWQELMAIQDTFRCCGKPSRFGGPGDAEAGLCPGELALREDCLQGVRNFLRTHLGIAAILVGLSLILMVYSMLLSSLLWAAIHSGRSLDRKGTYTLTSRDAPSSLCQPEPLADGPGSSVIPDTSTVTQCSSPAMKRRLLKTFWAEDGVHMARGCANTAEAVSLHLTCPPPAHTGLLSCLLATATSTVFSSSAAVDSGSSLARVPELTLSLSSSVSDHQRAPSCQTWLWTPALRSSPRPKRRRKRLWRKQNGRDAPADGNANEENGEQEADNEVDEEEEEEEESDSKEDDGDKDEVKAALGKRAAEDEEEEDVDTKKQKT
ncbi:PREDICTED: tetraspanin-32 [Chrysochloris asiatica]|uniref:Prothymosin alpha n=1 Tax=Chrysochloris asiatica TaxID=185453 RepID=A0A9B0WMK7_CHRAS|nr:PREDICTED: tetraspanin-32 [Chrysochloris asiatica]